MYTVVTIPTGEFVNHDEVHNLQFIFKIFYFFVVENLYADQHQSFSSIQSARQLYLNIRATYVFACILSADVLAPIGQVFVLIKLSPFKLCMLYSKTILSLHFK